MRTKKGAKEATEQLTVFDDTDYERQHKYVEELKKKGDASFSLVAAEAFVAGMRDSGYKSTGTALDEFVDNAMQAQAGRVDIVYTVESPEANRHEISNIAVIDDGHGMEPDMIRASVLWGGTHRANDRTGFGRYGFGLPSAAVSIAKHYEVYSRTDGFGWHKVVIDLPEICSGRYTNDKGIVVAPPAVKADLPDFVRKHLGKRELTHGTVVLLVNPDRLTTGFRKPNGFHKAIMQHVGLVYRHVLRNCAVCVNGEKAQAVDPLFLDPGARFYDVGNGIFAEAREDLQFDVKASNGKIGRVKFRFSCMPIGFQNGGENVDGRNNNQRFPIMADNNAYFIVCRAGRQIDLVERACFPKDADNKVIINYDRNWAVEVDFDPVLDEDFGITVNKQQVVISERMWAILDDQGVGQMVKALWESIGKARKEKKAADEATDTTAKESEQIMSEADKFVRKAVKPSPEKETKAKERVVEEAAKKAKETGKPAAEHVAEIAKQTQEHPYKVMLEAKEGAPFFRTEQFGAQKRLFINTAHAFYSDLYSGPDATARVKTSLELLLFAIGSCELDATEDMELFYQMERAEWSKRLKVALTLLDRREPVEDAESADAATAESEAK
jgi:hypothetical protein